MTAPADEPAGSWSHDPLVRMAAQRWRVRLTNGRTGRLVYVPAVSGRANDVRSGRPDLLGVVMDDGPSGKVAPVDLADVAEFMQPPVLRSRRVRPAIDTATNPTPTEEPTP